MSKLRIISQLYRTWQETAKDEVLQIELPEGQGFRLLTQVEELKVFSTLLVNKKGKVQEYLLVLDSVQEASEQLVVNFTTMSGGIIVDLIDIRIVIEYGEEPMTACRKAMEKLLASSKNDPHGLFLEIMEARNGGHGSVRTISGGLPTLGKRR
jgi:hypothetical protein